MGLFWTIQKGCLEVKCPVLCEKSLMIDVCKKNALFCLKEKDGEMQLSSAHSYYYQIQTEMHVTRLPWCDFVMWSPIEDPLVQRVYYTTKPLWKQLFPKPKLSTLKSIYHQLFRL